MHIPDGMLDTKTWVASWVGSAPLIGYGVREVRRRLTDQRIVLMAVLAALIFALQMLNFPVAGGTSGHFAGGAAAAILLGPWPAVVVMTTVLLIQALLFADGGITAFGANVLNLAVIGPFVGWWVYSAIVRIRADRTGRTAAAFAAAWSATALAAVGAGVMLWISGRAPLVVAVGSMGFWHAIIGIGEGLITAGLVGYLLSVRPDLLDAGAEAQPDAGHPVRRIAVTLGVLAIFAAGVSFLASGAPDGLEHVAESLGVEFAAFELLSSPMPDYVLPGVTNETLAGILAGVVGVIVTGALLYAVAGSVRRRRADS